MIIEYILNFLCIACIVLGLLFFLGAAVGLLRFPDFYTRMHATGKGDTLSTMMILLGFAIYYLQDFSLAHILVAMKIMAIAGYVMITSPTSTHALMQAGFEDGIRPVSKKTQSDEEEETEEGV